MSTPSPQSPAPPLDWHTSDTATVLAAQHSDAAAGLATAEAEKRLLAHGANALTARATRSPFELLLDQFKDFMIIILLAAAVVSGILGDVTDTLVIMAIVVLNAAIGFTQARRADQAIAALRQLAASRTQVLRDGKPQPIAASELVPGDIVLLEAGNQVPADLRLLEAAQLKVDESALTGESVTVEKNTATLHGSDLALGDRINMADKGTTVTTRIQRLGDSASIRSLDGAGYLQSHMDILKRVIHSEGGMVVFSGVVGSGKSTSLTSLMTMLPHDIKIVSFEDPVELEIPYAYQKTITRDLLATGPDPAFNSATRALYRSALDVLYLGEIRDRETGLVARQVAESGHSVYTTTHARSALGIFDRFSSPAIGVPRDVLGTPEIVKLLVYQALLPVTCPHCGKSPDDYASAFNLSGADLDSHHRYFDRLGQLYGIDPARYRMRDKNGCSHCQKEELPELNGFKGRTVVAEMIEPDEQMLEHVLTGNNIELTRYWRSLASARFDDPVLVGKTTMECAIYKAVHGVIDPREIEPRFMSFETVEAKRKNTSQHAARHLHANELKKVA